MAASGVQRGGILQVHPTTRCNLECVHCYSNSSPHGGSGVDAHTIGLAIEDAAALGFSTVSLSGGEPLVYDGLPEIVKVARAAGAQVNLVSNGILIASPRFDRIQDSLNVVALSLDGLPERHNAVRRSQKSFDQVRHAADLLRQRGRPFGILHTLTSESLDDVEELAGLASDWGAALLQLHPLEPSGRAATAAGMTPLTGDERVVAYLLGALLTDRHPHMHIQVDLVHRSFAEHAPAALHVAPLDEPLLPRELTLQENGMVVPLTYGIDPAWTVVDLRRQRLFDAWPTFLETTWMALRRRTAAAAVAVADGRFGEVASWHQVLREYAATPLTLRPAPVFN